MQQRRKQYAPDSDSGGSGQSKNSPLASATPPGSGGELGGAGGSDGAGSNASGPANLNDDDLGAAGLGVANLESSATGQSGPIDPNPLPDYGTETLLIDGGMDEGGIESITDESTSTADMLAGADEPLQSPEQPGTPRSGNGKTALVTGASSGIGRELANLLAKDGYNLVLVARSDDSLQEIARDYQQQFGIRATVVSEDLSDPTAPERIYSHTKGQDLIIDVLVNNAGIGKYGLFADDNNWQREQEVIQINSSALVHLTKLYLNDMVARNEGRVLLLGSVASVVPHPMMAVYGATKAFNYSFGEALRNELKDTNITVTVLMPPATDTDFFRKAGADNTRIHEQAKSMPAAEVAQAGYNALMAGKDKVAAGMSAKMQVASAHVLPDALLTQYMRTMLQKQDQEQSAQKKGVMTALAVGAAVLGGLWFLTRSRTGPDGLTQIKPDRVARNVLKDLSHSAMTA